MKRARIVLLLSVVGLAACDHHKKAEPSGSNSASLPADSTYTGEHSYPRALPVVLPVASPSSTAPVKAAPTVSAAPSPVTAPSFASASEPSPISAEQPSPAPSPASLPDSETNSVPPRLALTAPSPTPTPPAPAPLSDTEAKKQVVVLETNFGRMIIELDDVAAPRTCGNFRKLVTDGFYDQTVFHRVIPHFIIQGGDPNSKSSERAIYGQGDPGYTLPAEIQLKHAAGAVAMARLPDGINPQRDSNGSQFFICVADCPSLDGQYTVFGHLIQGLDVANKIAGQPRDPHDDPIDRIEMKAHLETKGQALGESTTSTN